MTQQMRELEMKALRSQMNPHFIYNALNSIQALVLDDQTDKATLYISKFGRLLRQVLNHADQEGVSLAEELETLELYIQLEQLRLHVDLHYHIEVDAAIDTHQEGIPPLVLQPFVENALWHGLSRKAGEKTLGIFLHLDNEWLVAAIVDNGIGRTPAAVQSRIKRDNPSKGIDITGRRIATYNQLPGVAAIDIIDLYQEEQPAGTKVIVRLKRRTPEHPR
jgi:sensor histidine kinase YesM